MKKYIVLFVTFAASLSLLTACGGSTGGKSNTTNPVNNNIGSRVNVRDGGTLVNDGTNSTGGSTVTPTSPGVTPYAHGHNEVFPRADLYLGFNKDASGQVYGEGDLDLAQQFGSLNCILPVGDYSLTTSSPGAEKSIVHNYGGVTFSGVGPVTFSAVLENSLSMQNQNGVWVMRAILRVTSVGGQSCSSQMSMYFSMPLAN